MYYSQAFVGNRYIRNGENTIRVADFFCGGGGFSEGFRQAGFEIVFAVDKWAPAVNTYKGNKPGANVIQDDVIAYLLLEHSCVPASFADLVFQEFI